jgi:hypothetical protein
LEWEANGVPEMRAASATKRAHAPALDTSVSSPRWFSPAAFWCPRRHLPGPRNEHAGAVDALWVAYQHLGGDDSES